MKRHCFSALTAVVAISSALFCSALNGEQPNDNETNEVSFDPPVMLMAGNEPINADNRIMYPSPAIFDVDNDGKDELVIGSISGSIHACENESGGDGDPVWSLPVPVSSAGGEPIRMENW